jgi:hypothetical protein
MASSAKQVCPETYKNISEEDMFAPGVLLTISAPNSIITAAMMDVSAQRAHIFTSIFSTGTKHVRF